MPCGHRVCDHHDLFSGCHIEGKEQSPGDHQEELTPILIASLAITFIHFILSILSILRIATAHLARGENRTDAGRDRLDDDFSKHFQRGHGRVDHCK